MAERRSLIFNTPDDVAAEVKRLRDGGYEKAGQWNLPQVCFHCEKLLVQAMTGPAADTTPEQTARRPILDQMLATNRIPDGIVSPDPAVPPADTPASAVDDFLKTLDAFEAFTGTFAPHRLFGNISPQERRRHQMIHCAHHLSYLVPAKDC
ncbi:MAG: DUF1569 domain-containing protein [Tepidisphaeraceae bacterium]